jgi:hypothetical protein
VGEVESAVGVGQVRSGRGRQAVLRSAFEGGCKNMTRETVCRSH